MRTKSLVLLLLALGCGLIAAIGISQVIERNRLTAAPAVEMEDIVVALKEIKPNEKLKADMLGLKPWPVGTAPEGSYHSIEDALKITHKLKGVILKDEAIVLGKFQTVNEDVTQAIPEGYRVVSIQADSTSAAGNLLNPKDRVDVLLYVPGNGQNQVPVVKTILQNIAVFSVNDNTGNGNPDQPNNPGEKNTRFVTLLVKPDQAKIVTFAQMQGTLKLSLRSPNDQTVDEGDEILNHGKVLTSGAPNVNNAATEEEALGFMDKARSLLDTLNEAAQKQQEADSHAVTTVTPAPTAAVPAPIPYETFQTMVIEGPQTRVVDMAREKKPRATWTTDPAKLRPTTSSNTTAQPVEVPPPNPAQLGLPVPNVKNLTF
ncbi:MAG: Flp pilus assembly protein CpaB [Pirellulales bacterium]